MNNYENMTLAKAEMDNSEKKKIEVNEAIEAVKELLVSKATKWQIASTIEPIALRILSWTRYHKDVFDLSYDNSIGFLNYTFFTEQGIIDSKKVAEEIIEKLVQNENLHINIRYKLACTYCLKPFIPNLWRKVKEKKKFYNADNSDKIKQPELVKFWSCYLNGDIDKLRGEKSCTQYRFEAAIKDGSEVAVKHYWTELQDGEREKIVDFAMQVLKHKIQLVDGRIPLDIVGNIDSSWSEWSPVEYYNDILFFLLSQMKEEQKREFFKRDKAVNQSVVFDCLLKWPYQHYFMEVAKLIWGVLLNSEYASLLSDISDRFTHKTYFKYYTERGRNDYCKIFEEFWSQSSDKYKRYILGHEQEHETLKDLILKLFEARDTTSSIDEKNVELMKLILNDATPEEKESIISFYEWRDLCNKLILQEKWKLLEEVLEKCSSSEEQINQFKKGFHLHWGAFSCLVRQEKLSVVDEIEKWSTRSKEETKMYKRIIIFSPCGKEICFDFIKKDELELAEKFVIWSLSSEEEIKEFKKEFVSKYGDQICENLIAESKVEDIYHEQGYYTIGRTLNFKGGKWEQVEMFLAWAFSSEEEIREFKMCLLGFSGITIHSQLIYANRWEDAERFFAFLDLSKDAIKELKKDTGIGLGIRQVIEWLNGDSDGNFVDNVGEKIQLFLRWCLADKEALLEFKNEFDKVYEFGRDEYKVGKKKKRKIAKGRRIVLDKCNALFKELLHDLA